MLREIAGEEDVYSKGAPVVSRRTDPSTLEIGDDITFMTSETTTVTHRIIGIVENYADTGQRAFQTQGVMNRTPDSQLVPAVNAVDKAVFHSLAADINGTYDGKPDTGVLYDDYVIYTVGQQITADATYDDNNGIGDGDVRH